MQEGQRYILIIFRLYFASYYDNAQYVSLRLAGKATGHALYHRQQGGIDYKFFPWVYLFDLNLPPCTIIRYLKNAEQLGARLGFGAMALCEVEDRSKRAPSEGALRKRRGQSTL